jgi:hypothetical protein
VEKSVKSANSIIAQIRNSFKYLDIKLVDLLYKTLVRPHVEYAVPVWNPYLSQDIRSLEKIQRKATKLVPSLKKKPYSFRLEKFKLTTLETRRKRGDLIEFYKIANKLDIVEFSNKIENKKATGPSGNLRHMGEFVREPVAKLVAREEFFVNRVIPSWNKLPEEVRKAKSLNCFKAGLDRLVDFS